MIWSAPRLPRRLAGSRISSCRMKLVVAAENDFGNMTSPRRIRLQCKSSITIKQSPIMSIKRHSYVSQLPKSIIWFQFKGSVTWVAIHKRLLYIRHDLRRMTYSVPAIRLIHDKCRKSMTSRTHSHRAIIVTDHSSHCENKQDVDKYSKSIHSFPSYLPRYVTSTLT